jgi:hypothetical protein
MLPQFRESHFLLVVLISVLIFGTHAEASTTLIKSLDFDVAGVLPSTEGDVDYEPNLFGITETSAFSVQNGSLQQRTMGRVGWANYTSVGNQFDHSQGITMEARLNILDIESDPDPSQPTLYTGGGAYFGFRDGVYAYQLLFDEDGVFFGTPTGFDRIPFDTSGFHTYRITTPGNSDRLDLFIDGQYKHTTQAFANSENRYDWGDGRSTANNNASVDWDYVRIYEGDPPPLGEVVFLNFNGDESIPIDQARANVIRSVMREQGISDTWRAEPFDAADDFGFGGPGRTSNDAIQEVVNRVREDFSRFNVSIVTERPINGDYMQVFVGGTEASQPGLAGVAQDVDINNVNHADNAIIFTDNIGQWIQQPTVGAVASPAFDPSADVRWERTINWLANVVSHEVGHNMGLFHVEDNTTPPDLLNRSWYDSERYLRDDEFQNVDLRLFHDAPNLFERLFPGHQNSAARLADEVGLKMSDPGIIPQDASTLPRAFLSVRLDDVTMKEAVLVISTDLENADSFDGTIGVLIRDLGDLSGELDITLSVKQTAIPLQLVLFGKSQPGGVFDLVYGNGFSGAPFSAFQSVEEIKAALLGDGSLSTVDDLVSAGFEGWNFFLQSPVSGGVTAFVVLVPEADALSLLVLMVGLLPSQRLLRYRTGGL